MKITNDREISAWCHERGLRPDEDRRLFFGASDEPGGIQIKIDRSDLVSLAHRLADPDESGFGGSLLWITDWSIWNPWYHRGPDVSVKIIEALRASQDKETPLADASGHLFGPEEYTDQVAFLLVALLGEWDAFLVPAGKDWFVYIHHDGYVYIVARSRELVSELAEKFETWNPEKGLPAYFNKPE